MSKKLRSAVLAVVCVSVAHLTFGQNGTWTTKWFQRGHRWRALLGRRCLVQPAANTVTVQACNVNASTPQKTAGTGSIRVDLWKH